MKNVIDQLGREVITEVPIQKIISLVPSITELLFDLGLEEKIIGRTKFCVHPKKKVVDVSIIGGTKNIRFDKIKELNPDLIIANKEENNKEDIEKLATDFPVWVCDVPNLEASFQMINALGELFNQAIKSDEIIEKSKEAIDRLKSETNKKAIYLIWKDPYMAVGGDTYINDMMSQLGYQNLFANEARYPELSIEIMQKVNPDTILLSSEPFPFKEKHIIELKSSFPNTTIELVDGELFSWYGSRLLSF